MASYARLDERPAYALPPLKAVFGVFLPSFIGFVVLDAIWITAIASRFYNDRVGPVLKPSPDPVAALLSWICIVAGNQLFVLPKTAAYKSLWFSMGQGALYGLVLYGTVDLTNTALLTHWPWVVALVDMCWGALANALLAALQHRLHVALSS